MHRVAAGAARNFDHFFDAQVAFAGGRGADGIGFVGEADMERSAVSFAENGDGEMPISRQARTMRTAISPRLAMRSFLNTGPPPPRVFL